MNVNNEKILRGYQESIKQSLETANYFGAISLSLMLPDICSKIEYPDIKFVGKRYTKWLGNFLIPLLNEESTTVKQYLNPQNIYALRCTLLHSGSSNASLQVDYKNKVNEESQIDELIPFLNTVGFEKVAYANTELINTYIVKKSMFLDIEFFCSLVISSINEWLKTINEEKLLKNDLFSIAYAKVSDKRDKLMFFRI